MHHHVSVEDRWEVLLKVGSHQAAVSGMEISRQSLIVAVKPSYHKSL